MTSEHYEKGFGIEFLSNNDKYSNLKGHTTYYTLLCMKKGLHMRQFKKEINLNYTYTSSEGYHFAL